MSQINKKKAHIVIIALPLLQGFGFSISLCVSCRFSLTTPMHMLISNLTYQYLAREGTGKFLLFNSLVHFVNLEDYFSCKSGGRENIALNYCYIF